MSRLFTSLLILISAIIINVSTMQTAAAQPCAGSGHLQSQTPESLTVVNRMEYRDRSAVNSSNVGYEGYCAVCIVNAGKWMKGKTEFQSVYDNSTYYFPSAGEKSVFDSAPEKFVPALGGDCVVCYANAGKRVSGNVRFSAVHEGRIYLFPSAKEQEMFVAEPGRFVDTDLAADGLCTVCMVNANKQIKGDVRFTANHNGFRYLFPSDAERQIFRNDPARFATSASSGNSSTSVPAAATPGPAPPAIQRSATQPSANANFVTVSGRAGCAACEHGRRPLGSPGELGLAINSDDGTVIIVENVHQMDPQLYADRFDGPRVSVSGTVIQRSGKFVWVTPTQLTRLR